jgi:hypothetical protein
MVQYRTDRGSLGPSGKLNACSNFLTTPRNVKTFSLIPSPIKFAVGQ